LPRALRRLYNLGIRPDWWKLEPQTAEGWKLISDLIAECDPNCKGVVILGFGADPKILHRSLEIAAAFPVCRGFAVGRSIFADAAERWFAGTIDDESARASISQSYLSMIDTWCVAARRN
jgi:5-dehydro-2-deoxygluconokinase